MSIIPDLFKKVLLEAFTTESDLNQVFNKIDDLKNDVSGSSPSEKVASAVTLIIARNQESKLIEAAREKNNTNKNLEYLGYSFQLYKFLVLRGDMFEIALESTSREDWKSNDMKPEKVKELVEKHLFEVLYNSDGEVSIKKFLEYLKYFLGKVLYEFKGSEKQRGVKELKDMVKKIDPEYNPDQKCKRGSNLNMEPQEEYYLLLVVDKTNDKIAAFFYHDASGNPINLGVDTLWEGKPSQDGKTHVNMLKTYLIKFIGEAKRYIEDIEMPDPYILTIEIALPLPLLETALLPNNIYNWEYLDEWDENAKIGSMEGCRIFLRSFERLKNSNGFANNDNGWRKWHTLKPEEDNQIIPIKIPRLELSDLSLSPEEIKKKLKKGEPIIIFWNGCSSPDLEGKEKIDKFEEEVIKIWKETNQRFSEGNFFKDLIRSIHQYVHGIQKAAYSEDDDKHEHIGYSLSVLCDPYPPLRFPKPSQLGFESMYSK